MTYEEIKVAEINQSVSDRPDGKEIWAKTQRNFKDHQSRIDGTEGLIASVTADHFTGNLDTVGKWTIFTQGPTPKDVLILAGEHIVRGTIGEGSAVRLATKRIYRPQDLPAFECRMRVDNFSNVEFIYAGFYREGAVGLQANDALCWRKRRDILPEFFAVDDVPDTPFVVGQISPGIPQPQGNEWFKVRIEWITSTVAECYFNDILIHTFAGELGDTIPDADANMEAGFTIEMPAGFGGTLNVDWDWVVAANTKLLEAA